MKIIYIYIYEFKSSPRLAARSHFTNPSKKKSQVKKKQDNINAVSANSQFSKTLVFTENNLKPYGIFFEVCTKNIYKQYSCRDCIQR